MKIKLKAIISIIIPISLAFFIFFVFTELFGWLSTSSFVLISTALILYFSFVRVLRSPGKIWFFLMLVGLVIAGLFLLVIAPPLTVMVVPIVILLLWLIAVAQLYFGDIDAGYLRPSAEKIALLICFLAFAPSPMYMIFSVGYFPIFYLALSMIVGMTGADVTRLLAAIPIIGAMLIYPAIIGFIYYVIISSMQRKIILRLALLIVTLLIIITAMGQKIYWERGEGTPMPQSTAIEMYKTLFSGRK